MSGHLAALIWEIDFPTSTQKLLMLRLADYADDHGRGIYPSIPEVARQVGASERQIQYALKALEAVKLIDRVTFGGTGPQRTNVWTINVDLVAQLALQELVLNGAHNELEVVENGGAIIAPRILARVQSRLKRVKPIAPMGEAHCTQATIEPNLEPKSAGAHATRRAARRAIEVKAGDISWSEWLEAIEINLGAEARITAAQIGKITVEARWPSDDVLMPIIPRNPSKQEADNV